MSSSADVSPLQRALDAMQRMRVRLDFLERARTEPIAVVGMACRFPGGADGPQAFWRLLSNGRDAVGPIPPGRWNAEESYHPEQPTAGPTATRWGALLDQIDRFDADFFGISPREAHQLDPQQRLLLEVAWEAFENASETLERLAGSRTGVFVGVHSHSSDYSLLQLREPDRAGTYASTGTAHSIIANRLSYWLDLRGPSMAIDTACSSSLVAVHMAVQSLRTGECDVALAAGVNLVLTPEFTEALSRMGMMAADGRCKTFDSLADGFVRGEGCGAIVLKRQSDAVAGGDAILAVIVGSAVNQDGATNGLTAPSGLAQREVVRSALRNGGVDPAHIGYVETHGTGTALGDPIEVEALAEALGTAGPLPCFLGAVKSNIGHLEGAAGIAGVIKAVLAIQHETIPPNLHFQSLNPHITLQGTRLRIPTSPAQWPAGSNRHAGVSSFGFGGTNAHVVVREPFPDRTENEDAGATDLDQRTGAAAGGSDGTFALPLSARSPEALRQVANRYADLLDNPAPPIADICFTAGTRRTHHEHRLVVVGRTREEAAGALRRVTSSQTYDDVVQGVADAERRRRLVFIFSGQGSQWATMGASLLREEPVFRRVVEECDTELRALAGWSLLEELCAPAGRSRLSQTEIAQPALFAIQAALAELWRSWGIVPDAVLGHSVGEVAAAYFAGALELEQAVRIVHHRGRLMQRVEGSGAMASLGLSRESTERLLLELGVDLCVAAVNGPGATVISGDPRGVERVVSEISRSGGFARLLPVSIAAHGPQMEPLAAELVAALEGLTPREGQIPIVSSVTGRIASGCEFDADYFGRNLRDPVQFAAAVSAAHKDGDTDFLEISPHPVLRSPLEHLTAGQSSLRLSSLVRDVPERRAMLRSLGALNAHGHRVDWSAVNPTGAVVPLPAYPWQRRRYWLDESRDAAGVPHSPRGAQREAPESGADGLDLPGRAMSSPAFAGDVFETRISAQSVAFLRDHRLRGVPVLPASCYLAAIVGAARAAGSGDELSVEELAIHHPLLLPEGASRTLQTIVHPAQGSRARVEIHSRGEISQGWTLHATASMTTSGGGYAAGRRGGATAHDASALDAAIRRAAESVEREADGSRSWVLASVQRALLRIPLPSELGCEVEVTSHPGMSGEVAADLILLSGEERVGRLEGLRFVALTDDANGASVQPPDDNCLFDLTWRAAPPSDEAQPRTAALGRRWLIVGDAGGIASKMATAIRLAGGECAMIPESGAFENPGGGDFEIGLREADGAAPFAAAWAARAAGAESVVVDLRGLRTPVSDSDAPVMLGRVVSDCAELARLASALASVDPTPKLRLWIATSGVHPVVPGDMPEPTGAPLWGMGRAVALEHPGIWGGLIDLQADGTAPDAALLATICAGDLEDQVAVRAGTRFVARLTRRSALPPGRPGFDPGASYLVTGGLGSVGLEVGRWIARSGAGHIVLLSRTGIAKHPDWGSAEPGSPEAVKIAGIRAIETHGTRVTILSADAADEQALSALFSRFGRDMPPLRGVFHAAGVMEFVPLQRLTLDSIEAVLKPKAAGAWLLHRLTRGLGLDHFVLFSSAAALWGSRGMAHYGAANHFMDSLAHHRRANGLPALSVNWGGWDAGDSSSELSRFLVESDYRLLPVDFALEQLGRAMAAGETQIAVADLDWRSLRESYELHSSRPLLSEIELRPAPAASRANHEVSTVLRRELQNLPGEAALARLRAHVHEEVATVLGLAPDQRLDARKGFFTFGMDSLMTVDLRGRLERSLGSPLPTTIAFEYPNVEALTRYLAEAVLKQSTTGVTAPPAPAAELPAEVLLEALSLDELSNMLDDTLRDLSAEGAA